MASSRRRRASSRNADSLRMDRDSPGRPVTGATRARDRTNRTASGSDPPDYGLLAENLRIVEPARGQDTTTHRRVQVHSQARRGKPRSTRNTRKKDRRRKKNK